MVLRFESVASGKNNISILVLKRQLIIFFQIIILVLCSKNLFAQSGLEADSMLVKASGSINSNSFVAEKIATMVFENNTDPNRKIEALFILNELQYQNTNYKSALEYLYSTKKFIKNVDDKDFWNIRFNFNLAKIYRELKILDLANKHFHQANKLYQSITKPNLRLSEMYNFENSSVCLQNSDYKGANLSLQKNLSSLDRDIRYLSFLRIGKNYIQGHQPDSAIIYFSKIPVEVEILHTASLIGLAESYVQKGDWNSSEKYLIDAKNMTCSIQTQKEIYNILSQKYLNEKKIDHYEIYKLKYDSVDNITKSNISEARNLVLKRIELEQKDHGDEYDGNLFWMNSLFIIICLMIASTIPIIYFYSKTRSDYKKYLQIVNELHIEPIVKIEKEKHSIIPERSEQLLLRKLDKFEESQNYLNPKITLTTLAKQLDTNTKYLSEVINRNKDKNFNSYINELRINYILQKLKSETRYRNYKIISLAEESGYNSQSTFIGAFRSITGISPASFINFLKKEDSL